MRRSASLDQITLRSAICGRREISGIMAGYFTRSVCSHAESFLVRMYDAGGRTALYVVACLFTALTLSAAPLGASTPASEASELPTICAVGKLAVRSVSAKADAVLRFGQLEATIDSSATYHNAFDPADIEVCGRITTPAGRVIDIDGFFDQPYRRRTADDDSQSAFARRGRRRLVGRYAITPTEVGQHTLRRRRSVIVRAKSEAKARSSFRPPPRPDPGFVRVSTASRSLLRVRQWHAVLSRSARILQNYWPVLCHRQLLG